MSRIGKINVHLTAPVMTWNSRLILRRLKVGTFADRSRCMRLYVSHVFEKDSPEVLRMITLPSHPNARLVVLARAG